MIKVKLRSASISGGTKKSLYLDFYPPIQHPDTGKFTRREYLELYIWDKVRTPIEKAHNQNTLSCAENVRAKRQIEIQNNHFGFLSESKHNDNFLEYFQELIDKRNISNQGTWSCTLSYLKRFKGSHIRFADINVKFCNDFKAYILKAPRLRSRKFLISQNSAQSYFNRLKAALKQAYKDGLLKTDFSFQVDRIKDAETERQFLTIEELNKLIRIECGLPILKQAALFSALTGLRFSDIQKMQWGEIQKSKNENGKIIYTLHFTQKKTKGVEVLPISQQAYDLLGDEGKSDEKVFEGLQYSAFVNFHLKRWILKAGITKNITFHCFRHTFATLQLSKGTDIFTVSKMLGHRDLKTTQIYAKVMDLAKREAADKIHLDFPKELKFVGVN